LKFKGLTSVRETTKLCLLKIVLYSLPQRRIQESEWSASHTHSLRVSQHISRSRKSILSWKACAYVKELRHGLSVTEKFVLLIIAEYHRTDGKNEWPSTETLALDCLVSERCVRQVINRLIDGGFLLREVGGGRGNTSSYRIVGIDVKREIDSGNVGSLNVQTGNETGNHGAENREPSGSPYKVLPVLETYRLDPEPEIGIDAATSKVFLEVGLAGTKARMFCQDAIRAYMHVNKSSFAEAADKLIDLWNKYSSTEMPFKKGVVKFFEEGIWKTPEAWLQKSKVVNAADEARQQLADERARERAHAAGN
jgi:hypothetical protein